jgi:hypothetical protein
MMGKNEFKISRLITDQEIFALRAVAYGCNTNKKIIGGHFLDRKTNEMIGFENALATVYEMIERMEGETHERKID